MHNDLVRMTREQLFQLLGPPDGAKDAPELEWDMGSVGGADDNTLRVQIKADRAVSYSVFSM
jgi:hypothetical protein